jgi:filamentous hemagglutinin
MGNTAAKSRVVGRAIERAVAEAEPALAAKTPTPIVERAEVRPQVDTSTPIRITEGSKMEATGRLASETEGVGAQGSGANSEALNAGGITSQSLGYSTVADSPQTLRMWNDALKSAANSSRENGYMRYLDVLERGEAPTQKVLENAFSAVNKRFTASAREAGIEVAEVHHWNYGKTDFPTQIVDPRNLVIAPTRDIHQSFHSATSLTTDIWGGPINPLHQIHIENWYTPLAPR